MCIIINKCIFNCSSYDLLVKGRYANGFVTFEIFVPATPPLNFEITFTFPTPVPRLTVNQDIGGKCPQIVDPVVVCCTFLFIFKISRSVKSLTSLCLEHSNKFERSGSGLRPVFFKIQRSAIRSYVKIHPTLKTCAARTSKALVPIRHNALRHNPTRPTF